MNEYQCVLKFDTDDSEFVRGFEVGRLWEMLKAPVDEDPFIVGQLFHAVNAEMIIRMFESLGRTDLRAEIHDDTWMVLRRE